LWPKGLPYPEAELATARVMASRRRQQRWQQARLFRQIVTGMVAARSFLAVGCPSAGPACACARCRLSGPQVKVVELMEGRLPFVSRAAGHVFVAGGRALVLDETLKGDELDFAYGRPGAQDGEPMQVCSERIPLPARPGVVNMVGVVPPIVRRSLVTAGAFELGDEELPAMRPGMCSNIDADEWQKLLTRMMACWDGSFASGVGAPTLVGACYGFWAVRRAKVRRGPAPHRGPAPGQRH
jgi:hypothetical protein